tara:strand:- start:1257 stop:1397 length:141 start_codon:yes stop_codon:yes gene_type:complete
MVKEAARRTKHNNITQIILDNNVDNRQGNLGGLSSLSYTPPWWCDA